MNILIKSMTGFGRGEHIDQDLKIVVEMKAVNHRYSDINVKIPRKLSFLETEVRNYLKTEIQRGKIDVFITCEDLADHTADVRLHEGLAREYYDAISRLSESLGIPVLLARDPGDCCILGIGYLTENIQLVTPQDKRSRPTMK